MCGMDFIKIWRLGSLFIMGCLVLGLAGGYAVGAADEAAGNLLGNSSFDEMRPIPAGWEFRDWNETGRNAWWGWEDGGRTGPCVMIRSKNDQGVDAAWTARVTVEPNRFYRLAGWIKTRGCAGGQRGAAEYPEYAVGEDRGYYRDAGLD